MSYRGIDNKSVPEFYDASELGDVETLQRYRRNHIPLMPSQIRFLRANGMSCGKDAMLGRKTRFNDGLEAAND